MVCPSGRRKYVKVVLVYTLIGSNPITIIKIIDDMPEWSKGIRLGRIGFTHIGSNPIIIIIKSLLI